MHKNAIKILIYLNTGRLLGPRLLNFCIYTFQGCLMRPRQLFGSLEYCIQHVHTGGPSLPFADSVLTFGGQKLDQYYNVNYLVFS